MLPTARTRARTDNAGAMPAPRDGSLGAQSPGVPLDREDAAELAKLLTLVGDWLEGPDATVLAASWNRFVGTGHDLDELRADLGSFIATLD
jgi:hypothetical protein